MRSTTACGNVKSALPAPISLAIAAYAGSPTQMMSQHPVNHGAVAAHQQSKWEVNDFEADLDAAIFGARVGPAGMSEAAARKLLSSAPWYASSLRSELNSTGFLRKLSGWNDSQTVEALITQQRTLRLCQDILQLMFSAFDIDEHANVCSRALSDFTEYIWKEVRMKMDAAPQSADVFNSLKIPSGIRPHLRDTAVRARKAANDEDYADGGDPEADARTVIDLLSQDVQVLSIDQERLQHSLDEFKIQVDGTVEMLASVYGDAVLRTQSNPVVAGSSGLQPNTHGAYRPLDSLLGSFTPGGNSWCGKDVTLPDAAHLRVSKITSYDLNTQAKGLFTAPIAAVIPHVSKGWKDQVAMMEYLGRPQDQLIALARARSLKTVLDRLHSLGRKTSEGLSVSLNLASAVSDVLKSPNWKSAKPHMRWMRACVVSKMAEIMRVAKNGEAMAKLMGGYISDPPALDYEYLRLLNEARMKDRHNAPELVYEWLTDAEKKGEALHPVIVKEDFVHDASLSISEGRLHRAGLFESTVVSGDVDYIVPPLYITAESLALVEDLTRNGAKIMTYEEMNAPDPKELDVEIRYDSDEKDLGKRIFEDRMSDAARFKLIESSERMYERPIKGCLKRPQGKA